MAKSPASSSQTLGHYSLRKKLGQGAMGQVWLAHDKLLDRDVAVKVLHAGAGNKRLVQDFLREAQAAAKLNHPNTVTIHQIGKHGDKVFIAMEYVEAGSLSDELRDKGALPWREATQAIRDAAAGLQAAHERGMVHRDVKPSNLMRSARGLVKVVDFGLAKARSSDAEATQTQAGTLLGSPAYMSPEQCRGERADARSDLYSLICSYYQLLTRQTPFAASELTAAMYQHCHEPFPDVRTKGFTIPDGVCRILEKGARKKPEERYQSAAELIEDLDVVLHAPEVSHTFDGKEIASKSSTNPARAGISFGSILRGKGIMGKTTWALAIGLLAWGFMIALGHRRDQTLATGQLAPPPSATEQYRAEREIKDVFKADYGKQNPGDRLSLARKLIEQGHDTNNDRAAKFVLFREARDLAAGAGDFSLAYKAVDELSSTFAVDATEMKTTALVTAAAKADTDEQNVAVTRACLELSDTAIAAEQYLVPARLLPVADAAARKAQRVALLEEVRAKAKQVQELRQDFDRRKAAAGTLAKTPNDPDANSAMGKSLCFIKGAWNTGLPMLIKGSDAQLKDLAGKELTAPSTGPLRLELANAWWDLADKQGDLAKAQVQRHAAAWYVKASPQLSGLDKAKADSRIPDDMKSQLVAVPQNPPPAVVPPVVSPAASHVVDVLKLIDVETDRLGGQWKKIGGALASTGEKALIQVPYHPPTEYDFNVAFTPGNDSGHGMSLILSKGLRQFLFTLSAPDYRDYFALIKGNNGSARENATNVPSAVRPVAGQKYKIQVRVRNDHVEAFLDGRPVTSYKTDYTDLSNWSAWNKVQPGTLGLATWDAPATIYSAEVVEVTGSGTVSRPQVAAPGSSAGPPLGLPPTPSLAIGGRVVDLMPLIDPKADAIKGKWSWVGDKLHVDHASQPSDTQLRLPYLPADAEEYDLHIGYVLHQGAGDVRGLVSHAGRRFDFMIDHNGRFGLENIDGKSGDAYHNGTKGQLNNGYASDVQHDLVIRIRAAQVDVCVDGRAERSYRGTYDTLSENPTCSRPDDALGLSVNGGATDFGPIEVVEVKGTGSLLRAPLPGRAATTSSPTPGLVRAVTTTGLLASVHVGPGARRLCFSTYNVQPHETSTIDLETGTQIQSGPDGTFIQPSPDWKRCVGDGNGKWKIWDLETGKELLVLGEHTFGDGVASLDGSRLLTFPHGRDGHPTLYDLKSGAKISEIKEHTSGRPRAMSPNGKSFAAVTGTQSLQSWDAETGKEIWHASVKNYQAQLVFSADGKRLLRRSQDKGVPIGLYNAITGSLLAECGGWSGTTLGSALSPDGKYLVVGCDDTAAGLRLFKLDGDENKLAATLTDWPANVKDIGPVTAVAFSPDSHRILIGCRNGKVRLYDVSTTRDLNTGRELASFDHGGQALRVGFSSDGRFAVSGNDTSIRVWRLP